MTIEEKTDVIMDCIDSDAANIKPYLGKYCRRAIITALAKIECQETEEKELDAAIAKEWGM